MHPGTPRLLVSTVLFLTAIAGCDSPPPLEPEIPADKAISRLVSKVDKYAHRPKELANMADSFAPGCKPSEKVLPRYIAYHYEYKTPVRSGDTATVVVTVKNAKSQAVVGEVKWSAKKVDNIWKLTDAPLPE
jgi:hypothetical protein